MARAVSVWMYASSRAGSRAASAATLSKPGNVASSVSSTAPSRTGMLKSTCRRAAWHDCHRL